LVKHITDLSDGSPIFIDANIFHFYLRGPEEVQKKCISLLEMVKKQKVAGFTSTLVIDELIYKILLKKIEEKYRKNPLIILRDNPKEIINHAKYIDKVLQIIYGIDTLEIISVNKNHIENSVEYIRGFYILPRDAIHLSVMNSLECINLASADQDFDRVDDIRRWSPFN
jgi:predicted nucleic acid-binding protein